MRLDSDAESSRIRPEATNRLHTITGLVRCEQEKIIIAPITETQPTMGHPRQDCQHETDLQTENDVEDD